MRNEELLIKNLKNELLNKKMTLEEIDNTIHKITKCSSSILASLDDCIEDSYSIFEIDIRL